jgi:hypothetical protein
MILTGITIKMGIRMVDSRRESPDNVGFQDAGQDYGGGDFGGGDFGGGDF